MENKEFLSTLGEVFYKSLEDKLIFIDSNIFMQEKFSVILKELAQYKLNIIIPKEQYDELYNLKKQDDEKGKLARDAFKLIENFLDLGILRINGLNESGINKNAYGDREFINIFKYNIENNISSVFFTNDADLRIRIKSLQNGIEIVSLYGNKELEELSEVEEKRLAEELRKKRAEESIDENIYYEDNKTILEKVINGGKVAVSVAAALYLMFNE